MRWKLTCLALLGIIGCLGVRSVAHAACCYFSAVGQDVNQPAQKAFITWDPQEKVESFTVQPKFEGNAKDFGMVIPTPSRPRLYEMPRDFFKELAVFTILRPMPLDKYKVFPAVTRADARAAVPVKKKVEVLESGVVGTLDYKIVKAEEAQDLYDWLKENKYSYAGDAATLDHYIARKWFFTVMKIDPMQQKRRPDGSYTGEVTPTRFTFASEKLIYPLRITQPSVDGQTEALLYIQAPYKVDMPGHWSYQYTWVPMWRQALDFAVPEKLTAREKQWKTVVDARMSDLRNRPQQANGSRLSPPTRLEWARKLTPKDLAMLTGTVKFDREADAQAIAQLKILRGHLKEGQWVTKLRKVFRADEMTQDLELIPASLGGKPDTMEYVYILPTSPP